jgi:hypothetical protein
MKKLFLFLLIPLVFAFCGKEGSGKLATEMNQEHPIEITVTKKTGNVYHLELFLPKDFGFQVSAPHKILLSGATGLKVKNANLKFEGPIHPTKIEYYEYVKPFTLELEGNGTLELDAKLYYCNFIKNICIPGKITKTFTI